MWKFFSSAFVDLVYAFAESVCFSSFSVSRMDWVFVLGSIYAGIFFLVVLRLSCRFFWSQFFFFPFLLRALAAVHFFEGKIRYSFMTADFTMHSAIDYCGNYKGSAMTGNSAWLETGAFPWRVVWVKKYWLVNKMACAAYHCSKSPRYTKEWRWDETAFSLKQRHFHGKLFGSKNTDWSIRLPVRPSTALSQTLFYVIALPLY